MGRDRELPSAVKTARESQVCSKPACFRAMSAYPKNRRDNRTCYIPDYNAFFDSFHTPPNFVVKPRHPS
jgi:hypothetical protein